MPAQTPAPGMQQTPNQSAGTMPSFPPQATPGQQMMEQFYQEAQANGNTIGGVTGTGQMTNPVMSPATGSVPVSYTHLERSGTPPGRFGCHDFCQEDWT